MYSCVPFDALPSPLFISSCVQNGSIKSYVETDWMWRAALPSSTSSVTFPVALSLSSWSRLPGLSACHCSWLWFIARSIRLFSPLCCSLPLHFKLSFFIFVFLLFPFFPVSFSHVILSCFSCSHSVPVRQRDSLTGNILSSSVRRLSQAWCLLLSPFRLD